MKASHFAVSAAQIAVHRVPSRRKGAISGVMVLCLSGTLALGLLVLTSQSAEDLFVEPAIPGDLEGADQAPGVGSGNEPEHLSPSQTWAKQLAADLKVFAGAVEGADVSVEYGSRRFNVGSARYEVHWGAEPVNVVRVVASSERSAVSENGKVVPVVFTGVFDEKGSLVQGEALAYTDAPDLVERLTQNQSAAPVFKTETSADPSSKN